LMQRYAVRGDDGRRPAALGWQECDAAQAGVSRAPGGKRGKKIGLRYSGVERKMMRQPAHTRAPCAANREHFAIDGGNGAAQLRNVRRRVHYRACNVTAIDCVMAELFGVSVVRQDDCPSTRQRNLKQPSSVRKRTCKLAMNSLALSATTYCEKST